jgi:hypothetical protein
MYFKKIWPKKFIFGRCGWFVMLHILKIISLLFVFFTLFFLPQIFFGSIGNIQLSLVDTLMLDCRKIISTSFFSDNVK